MRKVLVVFTLLTVLLAGTTARAGAYNWRDKWQMIRTEHFQINFPKKIEPAAKKAAKILEEVYPEVTAKWNWKPWGPTQVILLDNADKANGMASVLPYNWMLVLVTPPNPDHSLAHYDDWLRMLLVHEYTHIIQLDAYGGAWLPLRLIFQKTVAPSGIDPTWLKEGISQYDETIFTKGGRGRGAFSEMLVRTSILENTFPPIDVADGLSWKAPGYKTAYAFGIKFVQWLIDTYGEEKFLKFDRRVRSSLMVGMINHQARKVYDKTFYELWREWQQSLVDRYAVELQPIRKKGLTPFEEVVPNFRDRQYSAPTISPDGKKMIYNMVTPHYAPRILMKDLETGEITTILKKRHAIQFSWSPDGTEVVFASLGSYKRYYIYYDLWKYDFKVEKKRKRLKRLTKGARARDPDFFPDGKRIVCVDGELGTDAIKIYDIETKKFVEITKDVPQFTQFANPRVSPDGKYIAVSVWKPDYGWRVYRLGADGTNPVRLTKGEGLVVESRPVWSKDGNYVIFASDETGINNLYRASPDGGNVVMLTNVLTGAFQPMSVSDTAVVAQRYHSKGFDIVRYSVSPPDKSSKRKLSRKSKGKGWSRGKGKTTFAGPSGAGGDGVLAEDGFSFGDDIFKSEKYIAFGRSLFLPRFIIPSAAYADDAFFLTFMTGGADPLRWNQWTGGVTYRTDANHIGYFFNYTYNRFRPSIGVGLVDFAVDYGNLSFQDPAGNIYKTVHYYEHRRSVYTYFGIPIKRHVFNVGYFFADHMPETSLSADEQAALNLGYFGGIRATYKYGDAEKFAASISRENGRLIRLHTTMTDKYLGSAEGNEQIIFAGDWREYIRLSRRNVLALRAAGGMTWGDNFAQGTFGMGGAIGEGALAAGGSFTYFPFRGLPVSALSRTRAMLFSGEYRFPIVEPLRGLGTAPFFFKDISGALLVDYGNAWNAHEAGCDSIDDFFDNFLLSVGAELRGDFILGHGLPLHGRIGYAIVVLNRDRLGTLTDPLLKTNVKYGMFILALGTSF